jgi:lipid II:glycine glycyltransferase (peptidoglycan interpeptide bridge formation enzyme)
MSIVEELLHQKYHRRPTHTSEELQRLARRFPDNIKLFEVHRENQMLAGVVMYESTNVAHIQYIASSQDGKTLGAADLLLEVLINEIYMGKKYFDFGISTEKDGRYLNRKLVKFKEHFGARAVTYDFYELSIP